MRALVLVLGAAARVALEDSFDPSPRAHERAYCAVGWSVSGDTLRVPSLDPVPGRVVANGIEFACPAGARPVHTHTGATCSVMTECHWPERPLPCGPSLKDRASIVADGRPFGLVACRDGTVVAWRAGDAP